MLERGYNCLLCGKDLLRAKGSRCSCNNCNNYTKRRSRSAYGNGNDNVCARCIRKHIRFAKDLVETYFIHYGYDDIALEKLYDRKNAPEKIIMAYYLSLQISQKQISWDWALVGSETENGAPW